MSVQSLEYLYGIYYLVIQFNQSIMDNELVSSVWLDFDAYYEHDYAIDDQNEN